MKAFAAMMRLFLVRSDLTPEIRDDRNEDLRKRKILSYMFSTILGESAGFADESEGVCVRRSSGTS